MNNDREARKAQTRMQFNKAAADYDAGPGCFAHFGRRLATVANVAPGQRVLDVASGRGAVLFPSAESVGPTGEVAGIDLADEMVGATNEEAGRRGLSARVRVMDAEHLDFPDALFDRVLCGFGIMFFPDQPRALGEFRRVLKPGGRLGLSSWHVSQCSVLEAVLTDLSLSPPRQPGWITEPEELSLLLARGGFTNVRVDADWQTFCYLDADEYWQQARGTGMRRTLDALDATQAERARAALADRLRHHQRADGLQVAASALLAVADR
jgi:ubiquinone/menaquinone biosynthesis C-methylase UbiE